MAVKQIYFSEITESHLLEKANKVENFSRYIKDLMQKENFFEEIRGMLQSQGERADKSIINQFF